MFKRISLLLIIISLLIISCDGQVEKVIPSVNVWFDVTQSKVIDDTYYEVEADGRVKYEVDTTIEPERYYWAYIGEKRDTIGKTGDTNGMWTAVSDGTGLDTAIQCSPGSWRFYLKAYTTSDDRLNDTNAIYSGMIDSISFALEENIISIPIEYADIAGQGDVEVNAVVTLSEKKVTEKEDSVITKVKAVIGKKSIELKHIEFGEYTGEFKGISSDEEEISLEVYLDGEKEPRSVITADNLPVKTGLTTRVDSNIAVNIYNPSYSITYDYLGGTYGSGEAPYYYYKGNDITVTAVPTKRGCEFGGWNVDGTGYNRTVTKFKTSGNDMTFKAIWDLIEYRLTYDCNGGKMKDGEKNPETYTIESGEIKLKSPVREGYIFDGWKGSNGMVGAVLYNVIGDMNLQAVWTPLTYSINYELSGGEKPEGITYPSSYTTDSTVKIPAVPVKEGYIFTGWQMNGNKYEADASEFKPGMGEVLFTATWTEASYDISYELNNGSASGNPESYTTESKITLIPPTRDGYTFKGWRLNDGELTSDNTFALTFGSVAFTAEWEAKTYRITYVLEDGTASGNPETYTTDTTITLTIPERDGYEFGGWNFRGKAYSRNVTTFTPGWGDITFTAIWGLAEYDISYNLNGGSVSGNPQSYENGSTITLKAPKKDGWTFAGWRLNGAEAVKDSSFVMSTGDVEFEATWVLTDYTITYFLEDGKLEDGCTNPETYTIETGTITLNKPYRDGYYFDGWLLEDGTTTRSNTITVTKGDIMITAVWKIINFTVGGIGPAGGYVFYDKGSYSDGWRFIECASADLDKGYIFGWYRPDGTNEMVGTTDGLGTGKANTEALVKAMGNTAYVSESGTENGVYAAKACMDYEEGGYDDWYMPSKEEMAELCSTLKANDIGVWQDYYWTSTEKSATEVYLWYFVHITEEMIEEYGVPFAFGIPAGASEAIDKLDYDMYIRPVRYF